MKALILLSSLGVISLLAEIFSFKKLLYPVVLLGLIVTLVLNVSDYNTSNTYYKMLLFDNYAITFTSVILIIAFLWFIMAEGFFKEESNQTDHYSLVLFALVGAVILVSFTNMTMLFLGIEILSIPMYILVGSNKNDLASNEASFKYLIMGAFATGFLLFGIALIYGTTGSFDLSEIKIAISVANANNMIFYVGLVLMIVGLAFKVSAVPFHFWAPDVYEGAPMVITAFMSTIVKLAAFAAFLRLFDNTFFRVAHSWLSIVWVLSALTLLVGNITAVFQSKTKRMLAYSSVAHAGYMLIAIIALNEYSNSAILFYATAYSIGSIAAFTVLYVVTEAKQSDGIHAFNGLAKSNPMLAIVMTIALLSLAGIPPTAGFFAKYYIFTSAFKAGNVGLVFIAIIASLIGVYYYFRIIIAMYFKEGSNDIVPITFNHKALLIATAIAIIALGILPDFIIRLL